MLSDSERKLLRILYSLYGAAWCVPELDLLCRLSGRKPKQVRAATVSLIKQGYAELDAGRIRIVRPWENMPIPLTKDTRYWSD